MAYMQCGANARIQSNRPDFPTTKTTPKQAPCPSVSHLSGSRCMGTAARCDGGQPAEGDKNRERRGIVEADGALHSLGELDLRLLLAELVRVGQPVPPAQPGHRRRAVHPAVP